MLYKNYYCKFNKGYSEILTEVKDGGVGLIQLNRPKALNALCNKLMEEVIESLKNFDNDKNIGAIVLTGSEKAFAAGADIKEMQNKNMQDVIQEQLFKNWDQIMQIR